MENNSSDHLHKQHRNSSDDQGQECKLLLPSSTTIIKVESCDHHDVKMNGCDHDTKMNGCDDDTKMNGDEEDGFKTPTKMEQRLKVDIHCPPAAPMKPKSQLMKRRRPTRRPLFQVSPQDFELIFAPSSSSSSSSSILLKDDIKKVNATTNNNNLTTLMSFR